MTDVHSKETRSYNMSRIKGKDTKPEILVRKFLFSQGLRYKLHDKSLPGKPDLVFPKYKTALFVNGCFWHGHDNCKLYVQPKTDTERWSKKILGNKNKDRDVIAKLQHDGWNVIVVWECDLKPKKREATLNNLLKDLTKK